MAAVGAAMTTHSQTGDRIRLHATARLRLPSAWPDGEQAPTRQRHHVEARLVVGPLRFVDRFPVDRPADRFGKRSCGGGGGTGAIRPRIAVAAAERRVRGAPQAEQDRPPSLTVSQTAHCQSVLTGVVAPRACGSACRAARGRDREWALGRGRTAAGARQARRRRGTARRQRGVGPLPRGAAQDWSPRERQPCRAQSRCWKAAVSGRAPAVVVPAGKGGRARSGDSLRRPISVAWTSATVGRAARVGQEHPLDQRDDRGRRAARREAELGAVEHRDRGFVVRGVEGRQFAGEVLGVDQAEREDVGGLR